MYRRWSEYQGAPNKFRRETAYATINEKGVILMNKIAFESFGAPEAVTLRYDKANGVIGLKPAEPDAPNSFPLRPKDKQRNRTLHCKPFLRHYGIETDRTLSFNTVVPDSEGVLILDLNFLTCVTRKQA